MVTTTKKKGRPKIYEYHKGYEYRAKSGKMVVVKAHKEKI